VSVVVSKVQVKVGGVVKTGEGVKKVSVGKVKGDGTVEGEGVTSENLRMFN